LTTQSFSSTPSLIVFIASASYSLLPVLAGRLVLTLAFPPPPLSARRLDSPAHPTSTQLSSVEILPSAFPIDATEHFSRGLLPYVRYLLDDPTLKKDGEDGKEIRDGLRRATLVEDGELTDRHQWLYKVLDEAKSSSRRKKAVVLGAGCVPFSSPAHRLAGCTG